MDLATFSNFHQEKLLLFFISLPKNVLILSRNTGNRLGYSVSLTSYINVLILKFSILNKKQDILENGINHEDDYDIKIHDNYLLN